MQGKKKKEKGNWKKDKKRKWKAKRKTKFYSLFSVFLSFLNKRKQADENEIINVKRKKEMKVNVRIGARKKGKRLTRG